MPTHSNSRSRLWLLVILPFGLYALFGGVTGGAYVLAVMSGSYMDDHTLYCTSPAEARAAGVFIDTVLVEPRVVQYGDYEVTFENCWLGQLRESHRPSWDARRVVTKKPRAVFYLNHHTTYKKRPTTNQEIAPLLNCEQSYGGETIGQEPQQVFEVYADILPDSGLDITLPLRLNLNHGLAKSPKRCFVAYPARAKQWIQKQTTQQPRCNAP